MGILDFLKKRVKNDKMKEMAVEKLDFSKIDEWIDNKNKNYLGKEDVALSLIKNRILDFADKLNLKIIALEKFDLNAKRESERTKNIVNDSRRKYIEYIRTLNRELEGLEESKLKRIIEKINNLLFDFNKKSFKDCEKATFLIGKEIAEIKDSFKLFSTDILRIFDENKYIIEFLDTISNVKEKVDDLSLTNETIATIEKDTDNTKKGIKEKENLMKNLEKIKTSKIYLNNLNKQKDIKITEEEINKDISELKQLIDFKQLAGIFHTSPKKMEIIKEYKDHFQIDFEKDTGVSMVELLDESKLNNKTISEKIEKIKTKIEEIKLKKRDITKDESELINSKIRGISFEIENIKTDIIKEEKKVEKLKSNREEIIEVLKLELKKLHIDLVFS